MKLQPQPQNQLLLTAALLLTSVVYTFSANQCPNCGNNIVPYPLSTSPNCGDQSYKIRCDTGALIFDALNTSYPIISVDQAEQRLVIKPANPLPNTCISSDTIYQGIKLNSSLPFNITSDNTVLLFNCSESILDQPLDCSPTSLCRLYLNSSRGKESTCKDASICCAYQAGGSASKHWLRARETGCRAYRSFVNLDSRLPVDKWPDPGVEIQWMLPQEPLCRSEVDCDGSSSCQRDLDESGVSRCYCKVGFQWDPIQGICDQARSCENHGGCGKSKKTALIAGLTASLSAFLLVIITIAILLYKHHKRIKDAKERLARDRQKILSADGSKAAKLFAGKEIKKAINNLSSDRLIGAGGYGEVYKGNLDDGAAVAVKCAKVGNTKSTDQLLNEVRILCQVNHRNLVRLLGCCVELGQPILVYEYIPNGTLFEHLQGEQRQYLSWIHRLRIAHGAAECLSYLHVSAFPHIYHRDIKSSNILLDEKLNAKVSDFGLSRLAYSDLSHVSTCCQGTIGYLDPEYFRKFQLTDKSDVYSFGVVLLELLTSLKAIDFSRDEDDVNLAIYVHRMMEMEKLMEVIDPKLLKNGVSNMELESMKALALLALECLEEKGENRPSMKEVAEDIEYILNVLISENIQK